MHSSTTAAVATLLLVLLAANSCSAQSNSGFWGIDHGNSTLSFSDHVQKPSRGWQVVEERIIYPPRGVINNRPILAIRAIDQNIKGNGATAKIVAGGLHQSMVTVLFQSKRGHSVDFKLEVFTAPC